MPEKRLVNKVISTIRRFNLLSGGERVVVAVSGGPDSVFLLHILLKIKALFRLELAVAHFNHGIRKEADEDEGFVRKLAEQHGLPFFPGRGNVPALAAQKNIGIEEAARIARYEFLEGVLRSWGGDRVALGHTRDDLVETILFNLFRGTGLSGAAGIPPRRGVFIRPIIEIAREKVMRWLNENGISYRVDLTNYDVGYSRNYLRHKVIPAIKSKFKSFDRKLAEFGFILREQVSYLSEMGCNTLEQLKKAAPEGDVILDRGKLLDYHRSHRFWIYNCLSLGFEMTYAKFDELEYIVEKGGRLNIGNGWKVEASESDLRFHRDELRFQRTVEIGMGVELSIPELNLTLKVSETVWDESCRGKFVACFPSSNVEPPFEVRSRRSGDRIRLKSGWKSLKKLFIEQKIPRWRRELISVVADRQGILWVVGVAKAFRGNPGNRVIKMEVKKEDEQKFWIYD